MKLKHPKCIVMYGPTGVGKTDAALSLAEHVPAEIINMDMGQCYTPLTIGTAKPDWRSMKTAHHLFDYVNEPRNITVIEYRSACMKVMQDIWDRGKLPIVVGGSGFYLHSLLFPPHNHPPVPLEEVALTTNSKDLWHMLQVVDPERAQQIHPNDYYRLNRALAIWRTTGKKPSDMAPVYDPACPYVIHCLSRDRAELYSRIDVRVNEMMHMGWVNEVKHLTGTAWEDFLRTKKIIGYIDILDYLQGDQSTESLHRTICAIQQKTRQYAKRQMTFWRKLQKDLLVAQNNKLLSATVESEVAEVNLTLLSVDLYIKQLLKKISSWFV